jgi:hypothetical protein
LLTLGVILWLARDFRDEAAVRAVLIGGLIGDVVNLVAQTMGTLGRHDECVGVVHCADLSLRGSGERIFPDGANIAAIAPVKLEEPYPKEMALSLPCRTPRM